MRLDDMQKLFRLSFAKVKRPQLFGQVSGCRIVGDQGAMSCIVLFKESFVMPKRRPILSSPATLFILVRYDDVWSK